MPIAAVVSCEKTIHASRCPHGSIDLWPREALWTARSPAAAVVCGSLLPGERNRCAADRQPFLHADPPVRKSPSRRSRLHP
ncbi:MAG TPA: hypothetical protein VG796_01875 [Verrucomicrobiales bacterium]|nr:hypothetical protein [Verrucomicrobiales bacterium]